MLASGFFPLYLHSQEPTPVQQGLNLDLFGSMGSGLFGGIPLHVSGEALLSGELNLFLAAPDSGQSTANLNLFTSGRTGTGWAEAPLYLQNDGVASGIPLFIRGSGVTDGAIPYSQSLNLFLNRNTANAFPLYLACSLGEPSGQIPLFTEGHAGIDGSITLAVPDVVGFLSGSVKLFTRGW